MITAQQGAAKWRANTAGAGQAFRDGVASVQTAPGQQAAQAADRMLAGVTAAVTSGRWAAAVGAVPLERWKASMLSKGLARIAGGVADAEPKMAAFNARWYPLQQALSDHVKTMPRGSVADSQNRANYAIAYNAAFSKRLIGS